MDSSGASISAATAAFEANTPEPQAAQAVAPDFIAAQRPGVVALLIAGVAVTGVGTVAALATGANAALAVLLGYSSLCATAAMALALKKAERVASPALQNTRVASPETSPAWKLVRTLTVSDVSRLWCDIEPGATATQESMAWGRALVDAIKRGELRIVQKPGQSDEAVERERNAPHYMTQIERDALKAWAAQNGHAPAFLQD
jgi:hypothetical protein